MSSRATRRSAPTNLVARVENRERAGPLQLRVDQRLRARDHGDKLVFSCVEEAAPKRGSFLDVEAREREWF